MVVVLGCSHGEPRICFAKARDIGMTRRVVWLHSAAKSHATFGLLLKFAAFAEMRKDASGLPFASDVADVVCARGRDGRSTIARRDVFRGADLEDDLAARRQPSIFQRDRLLEQVITTTTLRRATRPRSGWLRHSIIS